MNDDVGALVDLRRFGEFLHRRPLGLMAETVRKMHKDRLGANGVCALETILVDGWVIRLPLSRAPFDAPRNRCRIYVAFTQHPCRWPSCEDGETGGA
ncbi:hypothetical protein ACFKHW_38155 [Bradyrhizobium lupini]|uniref:hypothetical protein n=1 Tax=Rhizobium lupini TaxID=136996 RepID=UPI00366F323C